MRSWRTFSSSIHCACPLRAVRTQQRTSLDPTGLFWSYCCILGLGRISSFFSHWGHSWLIFQTLVTPERNFILEFVMPKLVSFCFFSFMWLKRSLRKSWVPVHLCLSLPLPHFWESNGNTYLLPKLPTRLHYLLGVAFVLCFVKTNFPHTAWSQDQLLAFIRPKLRQTVESSPLSQCSVPTFPFPLGNHHQDPARDQAALGQSLETSLWLCPFLSVLALFTWPSDSVLARCRKKYISWSSGLFALFSLRSGVSLWVASSWCWVSVPWPLASFLNTFLWPSWLPYPPPYKETVFRYGLELFLPELAWSPHQREAA